MSMYEPVGDDTQKDKSGAPLSLGQPTTPTQPKDDPDAGNPDHQAPTKTLAAVNLAQFNAHMQLSVQAMNRLRSVFAARSA